MVLRLAMAGMRKTSKKTVDISTCLKRDRRAAKCYY